MVVESGTLTRIAGFMLIAWAAYHAAYGHRHRVRIGMQAEFPGLAAWSFLVATAHGRAHAHSGADADLLRGTAGAPIDNPASAAAIVGVLVHSASMLFVTGLLAVAVYDWAGLAILRKAWINLDFVWTLVLVATGFPFCFSLKGSVATLLLTRCTVRRSA